MTFCTMSDNTSLGRAVPGEFCTKMEMSRGDTQEQEGSFPPERLGNYVELLDSVVPWAES